MKQILIALSVFLLGCGYQNLQEVPPLVQTEKEVLASNQKVPYAGDALALSEKSWEEVQSILIEEYPLWDPITQYETGDAQQQDAFLGHFNGYLTHKDMDELLGLIYSQNDLFIDETFLPPITWNPNLEMASCEEFLLLNMDRWPENFEKSQESLYDYFNPATGGRMQLSALTVSESTQKLGTTCTEVSSDMGGLYNQQSFITLVYDQEKKLTYILMQDTDVDFTDGPIFQLTDLKNGVQWGARILSSQMAVPQIEYFYTKLSV
jgi:hypothetical protein